MITTSHLVEHIYNGIKIKAVVETHKREGWKAPALAIIIFEGKRFTPFEIRKRGGPSITFNGAFQLAYGTNISLMESAKQTANIFLNLIKKDDSSQGGLWHCPIIGGLNE